MDQTAFIKAGDAWVRADLVEAVEAETSISGSGQARAVVILTTGRRYCVASSVFKAIADAEREVNAFLQLLARGGMPPPAHTPSSEG